MAANLGSGLTRFYEDIEPFCQWKRSEEMDILEIHVPPGSKKEHMKIQISNLGLLTITGECQVDQTKTVRFRKELKVAKNCRRNEIRAKFSKGILHVTMPKSNPKAHAECMKTTIFQTLNPKPDGSNKPVGETSISKGSSCQCYGRFSSLRQRWWNKTVVECVAAVVVAAVAVFGVVKAYQYFSASPV